MEFTTFLFYAFAAIMVLASLRVITTKNPVHAALFLVLAFFNAAGIWLLLKAEFLAIVLVLVYVGAVMVLFLFVVMMLDINIDRMREGFWATCR
jgi:NADH-quinone oxidoreductase subunit J